MDNIFKNHLNDLSLKASASCRYTFTSFLSLDELSILRSFERELGFYTLFGGCDGCERLVARFGDPDELGYMEDFPIVCLKAEPKLKKFSDELTHRDFLGALMNLGIERKNIGDIIVKDNTAYIFILEKMKDYVSENLSRVKHTVITVSIADTVPTGELFKTESLSVPVSSLRLDCIIASVFSLSRNQVCLLFSEKKVFVDGRLLENISHVLNEGAVVSVRGMGKFIFTSTGGLSKKGRTYVNIEKYV